jgi:hypothetical protein
MDKSRVRTTGLAVGIIAAIACVAVWLRLAWDPLWPSLLALPNMPRLRVVTLMILALFVSVVSSLVIRFHWSAVRVGGIVIVGVLIGYVVGGALIARGEEGPSTPGERQCMTYLFEVARPHMNLDEFVGGLTGTFIPVVDDHGVAVAAKKLRAAVLEALDDSVSDHVITIGGPQTPLVDRALRKATRWLPELRHEAVQVVIVTPSPVSDGVKQALAKKGVKVEEITDEFSTPLSGSERTRLTFAPNDQVEALRPFVDEFWAEVLGTSYTTSFISNESRLSSWERYVPGGRTALIRKVKERYGVDITTFYDDPIPDVLARIQKGRLGGPPQQTH